ncbi:MAG: hypothetical protein DCC70_12080 [Burkholderiales bacterium]|nr:hypothetical protein [Burkholderiaceae bacterium]MDL1907953.1 hypothetical protein [Betaproteobacteria bacterium PRO1]RIK87453.1 MAG: hypothetical protein DCC70_12080 [Burkholderiales bacterium]
MITRKKSPAKTATPVKKAALKAVAAPAAVPAAVQAEVLAGIGVLNEKQARARRNGATESNLKMRAHLWPDLDEKRLWLRTDKTRKGFTTMPRTMALIVNLIDDISKQVTNGKAVPAGRTYLVLWCRVFDEGFVRIDNEAVAALEAGYGGERNVTTWRQHLAVLRDLGFIDCKDGPAGPYQYLLLFNPYQVIKALNAKGMIQQGTYTALFQRAIDVRATDLTEA